MARIVVPYQTTRDSKVADRTDHVWFCLGNGSFKCVLCGGVTKNPPPYPTREGWVPEGFSKLCEADRRICPPNDV